MTVAKVSHLLTIVCLFGLWQVAGLGVPFLTGVILVTLLLIYEHWLVRPKDLQRINVAFFQVNAVISIGLLAVAVIDRMIN